MISQTEAVRTLVELRTDELVVTAVSAIREWGALSPDDPLNFPVHMSMSYGSSYGLGLALARPDK